MGVVQSILSPVASGLICLVVLTACSGCGDSRPPTYPVTGIVHFPDGTPLTDGSVEFELIDRDNPVTATSEIDPQGNFNLGTFDIDDGALAGKYRAAVFSDLVIGSEEERPGSVTSRTVDKKFSNFGLSGLRFTVEPSPNHFDIEVEYSAKTKD